MKNIYLKKGSTLFLRLAIMVLGLLALIFAIFLLPSMITDAPSEVPSLARIIVPIVICLYLTIIPFYIALYQGFKLLNLIDKNAAFSDASVVALRRIKYCGIIMTALYCISFLPLFYHFAQMDDAPGVMTMGLIFTTAPTVVAVFVAVLERLLKSAIEFKNESDLTV